ncbi:hypothetical protein [Synechococcus sp. CCY 9618]|uniref:hypothetical protein n=1 Tax=Synechococcus sp. CCY 9618 TaxID=2815602 RepID=UPI001C211336|nr:hypothetical protein [Synechococcus sp. CCY 9618]
MPKPVLLPSLLTAGLLLAGLPTGAAPLPQKLDSCSRTRVKEISYRLGSTDENGVLIPMAGSGSAISYTNGGYQVSYDMEPAIHRSREGDPVELCLTFIPDCSEAHPGDVRGRQYRARNLRTGDSWTLPDSQHSCGGA